MVKICATCTTAQTKHVSLNFASCILSNTNCQQLRHSLKIPTNFPRSEFQFAKTFMNYFIFNYDSTAFVRWEIFFLFSTEVMRCGFEKMRILHVILVNRPIYSDENSRTFHERYKCINTCDVVNNSHLTLGMLSRHRSLSRKGVCYM